MAVIVIDPGHGGAQTIPGDSTWNNAVGPGGTLEKTLTLDIGRQVAAALKAAGHDVHLTRSTDVNLRLRDRAAAAKTRQAAAFVSVHFNGSTGHDAQGTETLVGIDHTNRSAMLSLAVQDALLAVTKLKDRNKAHHPSRIKPQALGVLRLADHHPATACCLAEISFLDRTDEEARLGDADYRTALAQAIAQGVAGFLSAMPRAIGPAASFGDAVEAAAGSSDPAAIERFLGLDKPLTGRRGGDGDEAGERVEMPPRPFAKPRRAVKPKARASNRAAAQGFDAAAFAAFITSLGLRHFSAQELLYAGASNSFGSCKGLNEPPPQELWSRIANTVLMLDEIRDALGAPVRILSCYRSRAYNSCIGGEDASLHMQFNAIDFTCQSGSPEVWRRVAASLRDRDPRFVGGIGIYPTSRFVHIDTRGTAANWSGS